LFRNLDLLLTVRLSIILVINLINAEILFYNNILFSYYCTCFEHYVLIIRKLKLYYTASGIVTRVEIRPVQSPVSTCAPDHHLRLWWYQVLCDTTLTSRCWEYSARNMYRHMINLL